MGSSAGTFLCACLPTILMSLPKRPNCPNVPPFPASSYASHCTSVTASPPNALNTYP